MVGITLFGKSHKYIKLLKLIVCLRILQDSSLYFNNNFYGLLNYVLRLLCIGQDNFLRYGQIDAQNLNTWITLYYVCMIFYRFVVYLWDKWNGTEEKEEVVTQLIKRVLNVTDVIASWINLFFVVGNLEEVLLNDFNHWRTNYLHLMSWERQILSATGGLRPLLKGIFFKNQIYLIPLIFLNFIFFERQELPIIIGILLLGLREYTQFRL